MNPLSDQQITQAATKLLAEATQVDIATLTDHIDDNNAVLKLKWCLEGIEAAIRYGIEKSKPMLVECNNKTLLPVGRYVIRISPAPGHMSERIFRSEITMQQIPYRYATHYYVLPDFDI